MTLFLISYLSWGLEWTPCFQKNAEAACAKLNVALSHGTAELEVKHLPAIKPDHNRPPIYFLAGGPGQSAVRLTPQIGPALFKLQQKGDLLFLSQLGTQENHPFPCPNSETLEELFQDPSISELQACVPTSSFTPEDYSTEAAARHLEQLRMEMKHEKIILFGVSYGTRLAQEYMRAYPEKVHSKTIFEQLSQVALNHVLIL